MVLIWKECVGVCYRCDKVHALEPALRVFHKTKRCDAVDDDRLPLKKTLNGVSENKRLCGVSVNILLLPNKSLVWLCSAGIRKLCCVGLSRRCRGAFGRLAAGYFVTNDATERMAPL